MTKIEFEEGYMKDISKSYQKYKKEIKKLNRNLEEKREIKDMDEWIHNIVMGYVEDKKINQEIPLTAEEAKEKEKEKITDGLFDF